MNEDFMKKFQERGLSSDCRMPAGLIIAFSIKGEYPCDRYNHDRNECRGFPRADEEEMTMA